MLSNVRNNPVTTLPSFAAATPKPLRQRPRLQTYQPLSQPQQDSLSIRFGKGGDNKMLSNKGWTVLIALGALIFGGYAGVTGYQEQSRIGETALGKLLGENDQSYDHLIAGLAPDGRSTDDAQKKAELLTAAFQFDPAAAAELDSGYQGMVMGLLDRVLEYGAITDPSLIAQIDQLPLGLNGFLPAEGRQGDGNAYAPVLANFVAESQRFASSLANQQELTHEQILISYIDNVVTPYVGVSALPIDVAKLKQVAATVFSELNATEEARDAANLKMMIGGVAGVVGLLILVMMVRSAKKGK